MSFFLSTLQSRIGACSSQVFATKLPPVAISWAPGRVARSQQEMALATPALSTRASAHLISLGISSPDLSPQYCTEYLHLLPSVPDTLQSFLVFCPANCLCSEPLWSIDLLECPIHGTYYFLFRKKTSMGLEDSGSKSLNPLCIPWPVRH